MGTDFINSKNEFFNAEDFINEELKNEINEIEDLIINKKIKDEVIVQAGYTKFRSKCISKSFRADLQHHWFRRMPSGYKWRRWFYCCEF